MTGQSSVSFTTAVIEDLSTAEGLRGEWDELAAECDAGPFARSTYALAWWRHLGHGHLLIVTVRLEGRLVALAPLHERRLGPLTVARWLGHGLGTVAEVLVRPGVPGAATALWAALDSPRRVLQLLECSSNGRGLPELSARPGLCTTVAPSDRCPFLVLDEGARSGGTESMLAGSRHRRIRRALSIAERRLVAASLSWRVEVADDPASWARLREPVRHVYDAAEHAHPRQHLLAGGMESFTSDFLTRAMGRREALVIVGFAGDEVVCFDIVLLSGTVWSWWVGRYHPESAVYSPGHLLLRDGLRLAGEHGVSKVDLLLGDAEYKRRWADESYETVDVLSGRRAAVAVVDGLLGLAELRRGVRRPADEAAPVTPATGA